MRLRSFYGLQAIFGIITTYAEWRICWLETTASHELACLTTEDYTTQEGPVASLYELLDDEEVDPNDTSDPVDQEEVPTPSLARMIYANEMLDVPTGQD
jgi:hypothetical protein